MTQNLSNLVASIIIAFIYSWQLTLLLLVWMPLLIISTATETKMLTLHVAEDKKELEKAGMVPTHS